VAGITNSASVIHLDTQFDSFLFAATVEIQPLIILKLPE